MGAAQREQRLIETVVSSEPPNEDELIAWLRQRTAHRGGRWIGDDAAVLPTSEQWAVTMDSQIEGVHFVPGLDPAQIARRLLAVNLSDLAAMGALPAFAFLALSAPPTFDHRRFLAAFADACQEVDLELAGGDLAKQSHVAAVLTLLGRRRTGSRWLRRADARVGEALWLGGTVGDSAAGLELLQRGASWDGVSLQLPEDLDLPPVLIEAAGGSVRRHLAPQPQLALGGWLASCNAGAAIDVSDGLARDLTRLCSQSRVGAELELGRLPVPDHFPQLAKSLDMDWKQLALCGGEDYVLLFTLPRATQPPLSFDCRRIGSIVEGGVNLVEEGEKKPLPQCGWDHLSG